MKVLYVSLAAVLICGAAPLLAQETPKQPPSARDNAKNAASDTRKADQEIAAVKLAECRNEVELAKFAQQKSQNEQVRQFAAKMIKDHGEACRELEKWAGDYAKAERAGSDRATNPADAGKPGGVEVQASREGVNVDVRAGQGSSLNWVAIHQQLADRCLASAKKELAQKEGAEFDKCYIGMQLMAHQKMIDADHVFATYVAPENKEKIDQCLKTATEHLSAAKEIMEKLSGQSQAVRSPSRE